MNDIEWIGTVRHVETDETQGFTVTSEEAQGFNLGNIISDVEYRFACQEKPFKAVWNVVAIEEVRSDAASTQS